MSGEDGEIPKIAVDSTEMEQWTTAAPVMAGAERTSKVENYSNLLRMYQPSVPARAMAAMVVETVTEQQGVRTKLRGAIRDQQMHQGLCLRCEALGHFRASCPLDKNPRDGKRNEHKIADKKPKPQRVRMKHPKALQAGEQ
ncbi:UNVERIFIED_CONTAM: hypothetical protein K2H54_037808 [Gekko kuhli]